MSDQYAVFGNPVAHSKSPRIHTLFARQTGENIEYTSYLSTEDDFAEDILLYFIAGAKGCNVTVPFKEAAWQVADSHSDYAARAKAANTLKVQTGGLIYAANTDGIGLVRDLQRNHAINLQDKRILLLGAGGAVRGVIQPLLEAKPAQLFIANRTTSKAITLAKEFADLGAVSGGGFADIGGTFDLIINGTSASLQSALPPLPDGCLVASGVVYDMMYGSQAQGFLDWGKTQGAAQCLDGLGMLVEQAAEAFYLWREVRPDTAPVLAQLREELAS